MRRGLHKARHNLNTPSLSGLSWIRAAFGDSVEAWIGLTDDGSAGSFHWDSCEPLDHTSWAAGEPSPYGHFVLWDNDWRAVSTYIDFPATGIIESPTPFLSAVDNLSCLRVGGDVQLSWSIGPYDVCRIYRNLQLVATLPGSAVEYLDSGASSCFIRYTVIAQQGVEYSVPQSCSVSATTASHCMRAMALGPAHPEEIAVVDFAFDTNAGPLQGYSFGLCYDPAQLDFVSAVEGVVPSSHGSDFFSVHEHFGGFSVGVVFGFGAPTVDGSNLILLHARLATLMTEPGTISLEFCDTLGRPPTLTAMVTYGQTLIPITEPAAIVVDWHAFRRGDIDKSRDIDVGDAITLLAALFLPGAPAIKCADSADVDDDGSLSITDALALLTYLFLDPTPSPLAPFPDCGSDPTPDALDCEVSYECP